LYWEWRFENRFFKLFRFFANDCLISNRVFHIQSKFSKIERFEICHLIYLHREIHLDDSSTLLDDIDDQWNTDHFDSDWMNLTTSTFRIELIFERFRS
jgi:hypothetical protein